MGGGGELIPLCTLRVTSSKQIWYAACHDLSAEQYQILEMGISSISSRRPIFRFLRNFNREKIPSKRVLKDAICEYICTRAGLYRSTWKDKKIRLVQKNNLVMHCVFSTEEKSHILTMS